jgi:ATP-dependent RNA helicase DHX57
MPKFPIPEILRTPLESLFLQVKAMNEDTDVKAFLMWVSRVYIVKTV